MGTGPSHVAPFGRLRIVLSLVSGALIPLSFAPFNFWPALFVGLGIAFWLTKDVTTARQGLFCGWLIGVGKYAVGASWIYVSIHEQGGASESLSGVLVGLFVAFMALFSGLFGALFGSLNSNCERGSRAANALLVVGLFAACWFIAEWCLTWVLTGFPWLFAGYGLMSTWLVGYAPVVGALGLSFLACLLAGFAVQAFVGSGTKVGKLAVLSTVFPGMVVVVAGGWGLSHKSWVTLGAPRTVALVQGNIEQITKWNPENRLPILQTYETLTEPYWGNDLIIWPEASLTLFASQAAPWLARWDKRGQAVGSTLMLGLPDVDVDADGTQMFRNTARALGDGDGRYLKRRLVPFGEYVPLESLLRGLIQFFDLPMSRSGSGPEIQPPIRAGALSVGTLICYEIAYPGLTRVSARNADVLVTISNDSWFGASIGPHQHQQLAQMRALENGRFVLRGTNNGLTAIIDERGKIRQQITQFEPGVLQGSFWPASGRTPFNRFGHWPALGFAAAVLVAGIFRRKRGGILRDA